MGAVIPFAFEDHLVRSVVRNDEPWFVGKDVCYVLAIKDHHQALDRLDGDERGGCTVPTPSGDQEMIIVSEPGVYRLIFTSRKPEAERFKRWLAHEVLPELRRRGAYGAAAEPDATVGEEPVAVIQAKVAMINAACRCKGAAYAARLWDRLGLPTVPVVETHAPADDKARTALAGFLALDWAGASLSSALGRQIEMALDGDEATSAELRSCGIIAEAGGEGFLLAHVAEVAERFDELGCDYDGWKYLLRRLDGVKAGPKLRLEGRQARTTFVPAKWLDPAATA